MRMTVLGSGSILSDGKRACSGYLLESGKNAIVLDLGYGAFLNLKKAIEPAKVGVLFFSHLEHGDHCTGLIDFVDSKAHRTKLKAEKPSQLSIFGPVGMKKFFETASQLFPVWSENLFPIKVEELAFSAKKIFEFDIKTKVVKHTKTSLGYRIECDGKAIAYSGDSAYCEELIALGKDADLLVLDCSFAAPQKSDAHMNAEECGLAAKKANAKALLLSHFYPPAEEADVKKQAQKHFGGKVIVAKDLLKVKV